MLQFHAIKTTFLFSFFFLFAAVVSSQSLFTPSPNSHQLLTQEQAARVQAVSDAPTTKSLQYVDLGSLKDIQVNGILHFTLPDYPLESLKAVGKYIEVKPNGDYTWWGEIAESPDSLDGGFMSYFYEGGKIFGHIEARNKIFEFFDLTSTQILVEYDTLVIYEKNCAVGGSGNLQDDNPSQKRLEKKKDFSDTAPGEAEAMSQPCEVINLLVLYSQNALNNCINLEQTARMAVTYMNSAIKNSGIVDTRIQIVEIELLSSFMETDNINSDAKFYGDLPEVTQLRNNTLGDFVILLAHEEDYGFAGAVKEIIIDSPSEFAISDILYTSSVNNLAHEVGHLFGCHHLGESSYPGPDKASTFNKGWKRYKTVVVNPSKNRIPYYSNPNIKYKGKATGREKEYNAQQIRDARCAADNFYPDPINELNVNITGGYEVNAGESITLNGIVSGGTAPYTYEWRTGPDAFSWGGVEANTWYFNFSPPANSGEVYSVQLTVYDSNNQSASKIRTLEITDDHPFTGNPPHTLERNDIPKSEQKLIKDFEVSPNPFSDEVTVSFTLAEDTEIQIELLDFTGNRLQYSATKRLKGKYRIPLKVIGSSDVYTCRIIAGKQVLSEKIIRYKH